MTSWYLLAFIEQENIQIWVFKHCCAIVSVPWGFMSFVLFKGKVSDEYFPNSSVAILPLISGFKICRKSFLYEITLQTESILYSGLERRELERKPVKNLFYHNNVGNNSVYCFLFYFPVHCLLLGTSETVSFSRHI